MNIFFTQDERRYHVPKVIVEQIKIVFYIYTLFETEK